jgi:hypothetical protein
LFHLYQVSYAIVQSHASVMFLTAFDGPSVSLAQTGYTSPTTQETRDPLARFLRSGKHTNDNHNTEQYASAIPLTLYRHSLESKYHNHDARPTNNQHRHAADLRTLQCTPGLLYMLANAAVDVPCGIHGGCFVPRNYSEGGCSICMFACKEAWLFRC